MEEAEAEPLQDNEALFEGTFFRVEDVDEPIDEADEWEVRASMNASRPCHDSVVAR